MKTTLGDIKKCNPCGQGKGSNSGWNKLVSFLGTDDLSKEVTFRQILKSNGIVDTVWALRTQPYRDYCLFLAEVAESVLHFFEKDHPKDDSPRKAIEGIRRYHSGEVSLDELEKLSIATWDAARDANYAADAVANAVGSAAWSAAEWAVWSASDASDASAVSCASRTARTANYAASDFASAGAAVWAASDKKWKEIEKILLKYI